MLKSFDSKFQMQDFFGYYLIWLINMIPKDLKRKFGVRVWWSSQGQVKVENLSFSVWEFLWIEIQTVMWPSYLVCGLIQLVFSLSLLSNYSIKILHQHYYLNPLATNVENFVVNGSKLRETSDLINWPIWEMQENEMMVN